MTALQTYDAFREREPLRVGFGKKPVPRPVATTPSPKQHRAPHFIAREKPRKAGRTGLYRTYEIFLSTYSKAISDTAVRGVTQLLIDYNNFNLELYFPLHSQPARVRNELEQSHDEILRLSDGWAGEGSLAPKENVVKDLGKLIEMLPANVTPPEFEVDASDGTISLVWTHGAQAFSITLNGNGEAIGIVSPSSRDYLAWSQSLGQEVNLAEKLDDTRLSSFFGV